MELNVLKYQAFETANEGALQHDTRSPERKESGRGRDSGRVADCVLRQLTKQCFTVFRLVAVDCSSDQASFCWTAIDLSIVASYQLAALSVSLEMVRY